MGENDKSKDDLKDGYGENDERRRPIAKRMTQIVLKLLRFLSFLSKNKLAYTTQWQC